MNKLDKIYDDIRSIKKNNIENFIIDYDDKITMETLLFVAYDVYKYEPNEQIFEEKIKRQHQKKFKNHVTKKYGCCIISSDDVDICEACHIIPFCESNNMNMYDVNNGLLLSSGLHTLFDKYMFSIDKDGIVVFSDKVLTKSSFKNYHKYHNMKLKLDTKTMVNIAVHYDEFIKRNHSASGQK